MKNKVLNLSLLVIILPGILLFTSLNAGCGSSVDEGDDDCATAEDIWGNPEMNLGEKCYTGSYGTCPNTYNNCINSSCLPSESANSDICTRTCTANSECSDIGFFCSDSTCQPRATCSTYCDEIMCCSYYNDPNDPTQCLQGGCSMK